MNTPLRRVASVVLVMFVALMGSTTWIQFFQADTLNNDGRNVRAFYREYDRDRGPIVVAGEPVAKSEPVDEALHDPLSFQRAYTNGPLYAHVTGFFSIVNGSTEIEKTENTFLNGTDNALWIDRIRATMTGEAPQGSSVELTLDPAAQQAAWDALGDQRGAVVAIEPSTGRILALVSKPSYDPNILASHSRKEANQAYQDLLAADGDPLQNRAIRGKTYPPGSTFKLVTSAAAIESGQFSADTAVPAPTTYTLPGTSTQLGNFGGEVCSSSGQMPLADALRISCNTTFAELGATLGDDALRTQAEAFNFDSPLRVPMKVTPSRFPADPDAAKTALAAIGQGDVRVTPLQIAMISAAIANKGVLMTPYAVDRVRAPNLDVIQKAEPEALGTAISPATAAQLTQMMVGVVDSGTGTSARISGVQVAGKTGTAQDPPAVEPHAWFTGFAPADNPQVAVAVIVENGGSMGSEATGGAVAAPIAKAVMEAVMTK